MLHFGRLLPYSQILDSNVKPRQGQTLAYLSQSFMMKKNVFITKEEAN